MCVQRWQVLPCLILYIVIYSKMNCSSVNSWAGATILYSDLSWRRNFDYICVNVNIWTKNMTNDTKQYFLCRLVWIIVVLGAFAGFTYIVTAQILFFLKWPRTVNIEVVKDEYLSFPVITLCNQNLIRYSSTCHAVALIGNFRHYIIINQIT